MPIRTERSGFTLIEIMVAVSIFVIVAFIATATLLSIMDAARRANTTRLIVDNMNFALDSMAYKMKFGTNFSLPNKEGSAVRFVDRENAAVAYCADDGGIYKCRTSPGDPAPGGCFAVGHTIDESLMESNYCTRITTPEITVKEIKFSLAGCAASLARGECPNQQVNILVRAEAMIKQEKTDLEFQTSVAQMKSQF
jgi:prepilin-type N-terminal cleavage/methylation domain-containing protein